MKTKFYLCPVCGNVLVKIEDSGVTPHCCGREMVELEPGTTDASLEKHVPVLSFSPCCKPSPTCDNDLIDSDDNSPFPSLAATGSAPEHPHTSECCQPDDKHPHECCDVNVKVGAKPHPMSPEHHIRFIWLETENGAQLRYLRPDAPAVADFCVANDCATAAYAYCNLHGLWKADSPATTRTAPEPSDKSCKKNNKHLWEGQKS